MIYNKQAYELGSKRSAIRELFEYGKQRAAIVGVENIYDFSLDKLPEDLRIIVEEFEEKYTL